ncbi:MAG: hypothetical protein Aurels2KO_37480 [Aureliella sp.]
MVKKPGFSRRENQIMDALYASGGATVAQICQSIPDPPTDMSIRRLVHILEEKGHVRRKQRGREVVYYAKGSRRLAGASALKHVVDTFFSGSFGEALAAHIASGEKLTDDQVRDLEKLIDDARNQGR